MSDWSHPDSIEVLPANASRTLWLSERSKGLGGSDLSAILGLNEYSSAYHVWLDKTGRGIKQEETPPMRWGKLHEPALKQAFTEDMNLTVRPTGLHQHKKHPILLVTPDGMVEDGAVFESKTGSIWQAKHWEGEEGISDHAALQVMHSLMVTGKSHAWVVALLGTSDFRIRRTERDQDMIDQLMEYELSWWEKYVVGDTPPPLTDVSLDAIKARYSVPEADKAVAEDPDTIRDLLDQLEAKKVELKKVEIQRDVIEAQLREIAGPAKLIVTEDGEELFSTVNNGTFAPSRFKEMLTPAQLHSVTRLVEALDMDAVKSKFPKQWEACRARVLRSKIKKEAK